MSKSVKNIIIVGGGTAGWLTACHLAKYWQCHLPDSINVTLIESPNIPTIGVGEGTVPAVKESLEYFGISETELFKQCDATFKQSIKFVDWMKSKPGQPNYYHHVFDYRTHKDIDLTPYWLMGANDDKSFVDSTGFQGKVCDAHLAPKNITNKEYEGVCGYSYHFDAAKFALLLTNHGVNNLGVTHIKDDITDVRLDEEGNIKTLFATSGKSYTADLFVDCSGFQSLLLGQAMNVSFIPKNDILLCDKALAMQIPYEDDQCEIPPYTIATAKEAGWIWDIGLSSRRGIGYVFSSQHQSIEAASNRLKEYALSVAGESAKAIEPRLIDMNIGYHEKFWVKNCVAIGLSQGFVEPLEATGLMVFDGAAKMLAELLPVNTEQFDEVAAQFNRDMQTQWDNVIDFVKLHYAISDRDDSQFWQDNRKNQTMTKSLANRLSRWSKRLPSEFDFASRHEVFYTVSYQYILHGMEYPIELCAQEYRFTEIETAQHEFHAVALMAQKALTVLPSHRALLNKINQYGLPIC
ncbi:tryptophan halogenase family protein [Paraferrimonas sp. SM1919]|uniref:tryptophan halogenase family protein n=1 Tax=Paraferrimonas sp. SM1919 TaxID=2662263 RepID=UPI0013CF5511|nr:tryptophan halogenase family protein [Paraferrimonas sp. SM1919]